MSGQQPTLIIEPTKIVAQIVESSPPVVQVTQSGPITLEIVRNNITNILQVQQTAVSLEVKPPSPVVLQVQEAVALTLEVGMQGPAGATHYNTASDNHQGQALSLPPGSSYTLVSFTPATLWALEGLHLTGNGDGDWIVTIGGVDYYPQRTNVFLPTLDFSLPSPHEISPGTSVTLSVTALPDNVGSGNFNGTLLGRVLNV